DPLLLGFPVGGDRRAIASGVAEERGDRRRLARPLAGGFGCGGLESTYLVLVLTALSFAPVSRVAPAREIGILIGTLMGEAFWLRAA
ncbi:MAG: hypothetical protein M3P92_11485, partial [Actinomycetota bacterium]|nr:hypothetical protein [Actinomycetota bacterium]